MGQVLQIPPHVVVHRLPMSVPRRGRAQKVSDETFTKEFETGKSDIELVAAFPGIDVGYVVRKRMKLGLVRRQKRASAKAITAKRRFPSHTIENKSVSLPRLDHPALSEGRTIYPSTVVPVEGLLNVLISGENSRKIGSHITKGPAKGFPIFTLTLEERATCPLSCRHWRSCYGNNLHLSKRIVHNPAFEHRLELELGILQSRHPRGFAIRLHVLGDFYSVEYVRLWHRFLGQFPSMMVFGFSARWDCNNDPIAAELVPLVMANWGRFSIRFSNAPIKECSTVSIEYPTQKPRDATICPAQIGKTDSCGTCGLCWHSRAPVAFLQH